MSGHDLLILRSRAPAPSQVSETNI